MLILFLIFVKCLNEKFVTVKVGYKEVKNTTSLGMSKVFFFLFSWRYNPLLLYFYNPLAGFSLLVFEVS
jgi:hypothetical protein